MMLLANHAGARLGRSTPQRIRLLIAERGAEVLTSHLSLADCDELIALRQFESESPIQLFLRVFARISALECNGNQVRRAALVLAPTVEPEVNEARRMLALTILGHAQTVGEQSELVLAIDAKASADLRREVGGLVESLVTHPGTRYASIRVRLTDSADAAQVAP